MENEKKNKEKIYPTDARDIFMQLKKMQTQLDAMEAKIDTLVQKSKEKPVKDRHVSKPYKDYSRPGRPTGKKYEGKRTASSDESKFHHGRPFAKKKDGPQSTFRGKKRPSFKKTR